MEQFFVELNTISFLSFKQIFDAVTALEVGPKTLRFPKVP